MSKFVRLYWLENCFEFHIAVQNKIARIARSNSSIVTIVFTLKAIGIDRLFELFDIFTLIVSL